MTQCCVNDSIPEVDTHQIILDCIWKCIGQFFIKIFDLGARRGAELWITLYISLEYFRIYFLLRKHSTFRHLLCFRKVFLECGISLALSVLFFNFLVHFSCFLFVASLYSRTTARTHGRTHASFIALTRENDNTVVALSRYPTFGTIFSGCWEFQIKRMTYPMTILHLYSTCRYIFFIF